MQRSSVTYGTHSYVLILKTHNYMYTFRVVASTPLSLIRRYTFIRGVFHFADREGYRTRVV